MRNRDAAASAGFWPATEPGSYDRGLTKREAAAIAIMARPYTAEAHRAWFKIAEGTGRTVLEIRAGMAVEEADALFDELEKPVPQVPTANETV